jgi:FAD/FMN-containing dehydrogenase/Fe-S oxidoreductase
MTLTFEAPMTTPAGRDTVRGAAVPAFPDAPWPDLAQQIRGELAWDPISRALYASSASIIEIWPTAVLTPRGEDDVIAALRFCARHRIPVTCRGAGSGVVGQSLGRGLILDFSVHMNRVIEVNSSPDGIGPWAAFEPGVVKDDLDTLLARDGLFWPPDPSSSPWCTAGAMVANNSGGAKSVKYGTARDYLLELDCLDWTGERFKLRPVEIAPEGRLIFAPDASPTERRVALHAYRTLRDSRDTLRAHRPEATRCSSGYNVFQPLALDSPLPGDPGFETALAAGTVPSRPKHCPIPDRHADGFNLSGNPWILDMPRLFCGSEGSLGVLLRAKVRVVKLPQCVAGASWSFESDEQMSHAVVKLLANSRPAKLELLDRSFIDVAARAEPDLAAGIPANLKTLVVGEFFGDSPEDCARQADHAVALLRANETDGKFADTPLAFAAAAAYDPRNLDKLWRIRKVASPILSRVKGDVKPTRWVEDLAVPPWKLPEFIAGIKAIFAEAGLPAALFGHAGEGNLHVNPRTNTKDPALRITMRAVADRAFAFTKSLNGVISGEHGDGTMRSPYLKRMFGPAWDVMREVKQEWDPLWLLNPLTKVMRDEDAAARDVLTDARVGEGYSRHDTGTAALNRPEVLEEIEKCHGCGKCRTYCPLMTLGKEEKYTARAKANMLRAVVAGRLDADLFLGDQSFRDNIDLCINCGQCLVECPTQVDIPGIAIAFREQFQSRAGGSTGSNGTAGNSHSASADGFLSGLLAKPDKLGRMATIAPALSNSLLNNRFIRGMAEKTLGLDSRRHLPEYRRELGLPELPALTIPPNLRAELAIPAEAVIFPGCWANYNDPDGEKNALIRILQALGIHVHAPKLACCGISKITQGQTAAAARDLEDNVALLAPFVARGCPVFFSAPSCLLASTHDLPRLVPTPEGKAVGAASTDAHAFLRRVFSHPSLRAQLRPLPADLKRAAYHQPCHSKVNNVGAEPMKLIELIPEESVENLNAGCCGLSGTFGMKTDNFDMSLKIGAKLFSRIEQAAPDVVFTPCGVCQTQIMQGAPEAKVVHPLRLLYDALSNR